MYTACNFTCVREMNIANSALALDARTQRNFTISREKIGTLWWHRTNSKLWSAAAAVKFHKDVYAVQLAITNV